MIKKIGIIVAAATLLSSCASYTPHGVIYSGGTTGVSANNDIKPDKTGTSCVVSVLGLVSTGDGSIAAAKLNGNITKVASVDYDAFNVLGIYGKYCTVIKGE